MTRKKNKEMKLAACMEIENMIDDVDDMIRAVILKCNETLPVTICRKLFSSHEWIIKFKWELDHYVKRLR